MIPYLPPQRLDSAIQVNRNFSNRRYLTIFSSWFCILAIVSGFVLAYFPEYDLFQFFISILNAILLYYWAVMDASFYHHQLPMRSRPWFILFAGIAVPIYLIKTRGMRGLIWTIVFASVWLILSVSSYVLTTMIFDVSEFT